ncbi:GNAT family N-acetyltransferase [Patescibacteria group bacterium]|nr:GNAT family N-acetyltransferase [Patescibacteria group bacterium]MBU1895275.1 GNAT family N-acetyltransferase [Patescibacteria group bacterium]
MEVKKEHQDRAYATKFVVESDGNVAGRGYLYIIYNDLHDLPYGLVEDVFVEEDFRRKGIGTKLMNSIIDEAKNIGCYKIIAQSRHDRREAHEFYDSMGFHNHGLNFRMDW